jgi:hypothetical protein
MIDVCWEDSILWYVDLDNIKIFDNWSVYY